MVAVNFEERFHLLLTALATRCNTQLGEVEIELYDRMLEPHGYENVCRALELIMIERRSNEPLPSVRQIMEKMGRGELSEKSRAVEVVNAIVRCVRRKGRYWPYESNFSEQLEQELGEDGAAAVRALGGWEAVIEMSDDNPRMYHLRLQETVGAYIERQRMKSGVPALGAPLGRAALPGKK